MTAMIENLLVALIVMLAALYAGVRFLPASWRRRLVSLLTRGATGGATAARWFSGESGCSSCDTCKACADPAPARHVVKLHRRG